MLIRRILCPMDFSARSEAALQFAESLARDTGAEMILLNVVEPIPLHREVPYAAIYDPDITEPRRRLDALVVDPAVTVRRLVVRDSLRSDLAGRRAGTR